jgi:hypothetical protein
MLRLLLIIPLVLVGVALMVIVAMPFVIVYMAIQVVYCQIAYWRSSAVFTHARILGKWKGHAEVLVFSVDGRTITFRPVHMSGCLLISSSDLDRFSVPEGTTGTLITRGDRFVSFIPDR